MTNYPNITISLYDPYPIKVLNIKQYDTGRGALVTLTGLGGDVITPTGNGLYVYAKKRDGNIIYNTVTLVGSQVQIDFDEQMTVLSGILQVEIQMIDPEGKTISTPIFMVNVMPSNIDTLQIESTSEYQALVDALAQVQGFDQVKQSIGTLSELSTTAKDNLVAAINEVDGDIGNLSGLTTTAKNNLVAALNELNQKMNSVESGIIYNGSSMQIKMTYACFGFIGQADSNPLYFYSGLNDYKIIYGTLGNVTIEVISGVITITNNMGWSIPVMALKL